MCDLRLAILAVVETPEYGDVGAEFVIEDVGADPVDDSAVVEVVEVSGDVSVSSVVG